MWCSRDSAIAKSREERGEVMWKSLLQATAVQLNLIGAANAWSVDAVPPDSRGSYIVHVASSVFPTTLYRPYRGEG